MLKWKKNFKDLAHAPVKARFRENANFLMLVYLSGLFKQLYKKLRRKSVFDERKILPVPRLWVCSP